MRQAAGWEGARGAVRGCTWHVQLYASGRGEGKEKGSDHYGALGFPSKIAKDLKGAID